MKHNEPLVSDEWKHSKSPKKGTKKWCRGKEGVEHVPIIIIDKSTGFLGTSFCMNHKDDQKWYQCNHTVVCENCGKTLQSHPDVCPDTGNKLV